MTDALSWVRAHGLTAIPLAAPILGDIKSGKKPLYDDWNTRTFTDADFLPNGNVGVRGGDPVPGEGFLLVVDVDGEEGQENWLQLVEDEGDLPPTLEVKSGGGMGYHLYFRTTRPFGCAPIDGCKKVDIRGKGGQVVAPGCVHFSGGVYVAIERPIAWAPTWLEEVLARKEHGVANNPRLSVAEISAMPQVVLSPDLFRDFCARAPSHAITPYLNKILAGQPISSPGNRHAEIRLGFIKLLCAAFGPNIQFESLCQCLYADYPQGMSADDIERTRDALVSAAKKTDPSEAITLRTAGNMFATMRQSQVEAVTQAREAVAELAEPMDQISAALEAKRLGMTLDNKGRVKSCPENRQMILRLFFGPRLRVNIRGDVLQARACPGQEGENWQPLSEFSVGAWQEHLATRWGVSCSKSELLVDLEHIARARVYDPVREYLDGLVWDGVPRLDGFLGTVLGVEGGLAAAYARCFFLGAVARTYEPGCKLDTQLILFSPQGVGKSTFFRNLCADPAWFSDKQAYQGETQRDLVDQLHGCWIWEDSEMVASAKDQAHKKAFLSTQADKLRKAYARLPVTLPRRFVCAGSTNIELMLQDPTGSRRFHVISVKVPFIDQALVASMRDQVWAEAKARYQAKEPYWLTKEEQAESSRLNEEMFTAETQGEIDATAIETWMRTVRAEGMISNGEMFGTVKTYPKQYAADGTLWVASRLQIAAALGLKAHAINAAVDRLTARGWVKKAQVMIRPDYLRSSVLVPDWEQKRPT